MLWSALASTHVLLYAAATTWIVTHMAAWAHLLWLRRQHPPCPLPSPSTQPLPTLTVQLPLYNEAPSVDSLLDSIAALDWPQDRLEVQVLDDSTDDTPAVVAARLESLRDGGLDIHHIRRSDRSGFKAGALSAGLETARGSLVAIFDADFRPAPDFLRLAAAALEPEIGLVQARWAFTNRGASVLTRAQALHLDAHFAFEQQARSEGGLLMGFNGTAGLWRRACIEASGGWEGDTLTEDLDLAYRAQLKGWRLRYLDALSADSELPESIGAIRSQQHRWIRGGAQVARKLLSALWSSDLPLRRKLQGTAHLLASSVFLPVLTLCLLSPAIPLLYPHAAPAHQLLWGACGLALEGVLLLLLVIFGSVCVHRAGSLRGGLYRMVKDFPVYFALATAICVHNAQAAWLGWRGPTGTFVRTPKRGHARRAAGPTLPELALTAWSAIGMVAAASTGQWLTAAFLGLQTAALTSWAILSAVQR